MADDPKSKFLFEGSYGCAYTPPVPCKKSKAKGRKSRTVGKVMKKKNSVYELDISKYIMEIPEHEKYFIAQEKDSCDTKNFEHFRGTYQSTCGIWKKTKSSNLVQLLAPYGGRTLHDYFITENFDYIGKLRHILTAVDKLAKKGICHYDLHDGNILVDPLGNFRLIDFGSAFLGDQLTFDKLWRLQYSFSPQFPPQPPELSVQNGLHQGLSLSFSIQQTLEDKKEFEKMQQQLGLTIEEQKDSMIRFWRQEFPRIDKKDWTPFFKKFWRSWDPWGVGVIFLKLLWKSSFNPKFIEEVWRPNQNILSAVLKGLLRANPYERLSAESALRILDLIPHQQKGGALSKDDLETLLMFI